MTCRTMEISKRGGGLRRIEVPPEHLKGTQRQLLKHLAFCDPIRTLGTQQALKEIQRNINEGFQWVAAIDIKNCFPSINPKKTLGMIDTRITEGVPGLYGRRRLPQGHPIFPYLAERYLGQFDRMVESWQTPTCLPDGSTMECRVIRYVDNIWLMCRKKKELDCFTSMSLRHLSDLGFTPRVESVKHANEGIDILGRMVNRWSTGPNSRNIQRFKERCTNYAFSRKELESELSRAGTAESIEEIRAGIDCLDRRFYESLKGWENHFGPAMRSWLDRFLLGLNIDIPYLHNTREVKHHTLVNFPAMKDQTGTGAGTIDYAHVLPNLASFSGVEHHEGRQ